MLALARKLLNKVECELLGELWLHQERLSKESHRLAHHQLLLSITTIVYLLCEVLLARMTAVTSCTRLHNTVRHLEDLAEQDLCKLILLLIVEVAMVMRLQKQSVQVDVQENWEDSLVVHNVRSSLQLDILVEREEEDDESFAEHVGIPLVLSIIGGKIVRQSRMQLRLDIFNQGDQDLILV